MLGWFGRYGNTAAATSEGRVKHARHVTRHTDHMVPLKHSVGSGKEVLVSSPFDLSEPSKAEIPPPHSLEIPPGCDSRVNILWISWG
jgi:hypothetical protein